MEFLKSEEARKPGSSYRLMIESAINRFENIDQGDIPYLFLAAISLGKSTLKLFS